MAPHSSTLAWKISWVVGYSPWDCKELDMAEQLHFFTSMSHISYTEITNHSHIVVQKDTTSIKYKLRKGDITIKRVIEETDERVEVSKI